MTRTATRRTATPRYRGSASRGGSTILGIFIGLMLGAALASGTAWYFTRNSPFKPASHSSESVPGQQSLALPGRPGGAPVSRPDLDFYKVLPNGQPGGTAGQAQNTAGGGTAATMPPPVDQIAAIAQRPDTAPTAQDNKRQLYLQVGAYVNATEAENVRALLTLNGIDASTQQARLGDGRTVHRVRVGPFSSPGEMDAIRSRLSAAGMNSAPVSIQ